MQEPNNQNTLIVQSIHFHRFIEEIHFHCHCQARLFHMLNTIINTHDPMQNPGQSWMFIKWAA